MNIDIRTTKELISDYETIKNFDFTSDNVYKEFLERRWISIKSLLIELERQIEEGNVEGVGGHKAFSAAIFLSNLKKAVEGQK